MNGIVARIDQEANVIEQNAAQVSHYSDTNMDVNWVSLSLTDQTPAREPAETARLYQGINDRQEEG